MRRSRPRSRIILRFRRTRHIRYLGAAYDFLTNQRHNLPRISCGRVIDVGVVAVFPGLRICTVYQFFCSSNIGLRCIAVGIVFHDPLLGFIVKAAKDVRLFFTAFRIIFKACHNRTIIQHVGFWDSIPLWAVTLIGGLLITVLSFTMILTVYGRMFSLWMYAAIAPIPLSTFAGEPTSSVGKNFIRSYAGVCLQGVVIALSCIIFSAISSSPPAVDTGASVVTAVWTYVGELAFNLLVLVGAIKGCDRIVKEIMGL